MAKLKLTVYLTPAAYKRLKLIALEERAPHSTVIEQAITEVSKRRWLAKRQKGAAQ